MNGMNEGMERPESLWKRERNGVLTDDIWTRNSVVLQAESKRVSNSKRGERRERGGTSGTREGIS